MVQADAPELLHTVAEVAALTKSSRSTIIRAYKSGRLRVIYLGEGTTKPRIRHDDLIAWVNSAPTNVTDEDAGAA